MRRLSLPPDSYDDLVQLFQEWRELETPPLLDGAPDYTAERFEETYAELPAYRARLNAIDVTGWPVEQQVDWHVVNAEMNGFDFNHRVLKPWVRDPAFYQSIWTARSDVPAHGGTDPTMPSSSCGPMSSPSPMTRRLGWYVSSASSRRSCVRHGAT